MAIHNGHVLRWAIGDETTQTVIAKATGGSLDVSSETTETTHKDSAGGTTGWKNVDYGTKSATGSVTMYFDQTDSTDNWKTLYDNMVAGTKTNVIVSDFSSSGTWQYYKGSAVITGFQKTFNNNEPVEITVNFEFDGGLTTSTLTVV